MRKLFLFWGIVLLALCVNAETMTDYASAEVYSKSTEGLGENEDGLYVWKSMGARTMPFEATDAIRFTFTGVTPRTSQAYAIQIQTTNGNIQMNTNSFISDGYIFEIELAEVYAEEVALKEIGIMNTKVIEGDGTPFTVKAELISGRSASDPSFTLAYNEIAQNYQAEVGAKLTEVPLCGSSVKWTIEGYADEAVNDIQVLLVSKAKKDDWWKEMSAESTEEILSTSGDGNLIEKTTLTLKVKDDVSVSSETKASDLFFIVYSGTATDVIRIYYTTFKVEVEGGHPCPEEQDAVKTVSADKFAVVDGMVYSAGEIVVYNVVGKVVATAFQAFNVNSLEVGVYFITAQEGTLKFVK